MSWASASRDVRCSFTAVWGDVSDMAVAYLARGAVLLWSLAGYSFLILCFLLFFVCPLVLFCDGNAGTTLDVRGLKGCTRAWYLLDVEASPYNSTIHRYIDLTSLSTRRSDGGCHRASSPPGNPRHAASFPSQIGARVVKSRRRRESQSASRTRRWLLCGATSTVEGMDIPCLIANGL